MNATSLPDPGRLACGGEARKQRRYAGPILETDPCGPCVAWAGDVIYVAGNDHHAYYGHWAKEDRERAHSNEIEAFRVERDVDATPPARAIHPGAEPYRIPGATVRARPTRALGSSENPTNGARYA
jgi:hypothetical protein